MCIRDRGYSGPARLLLVEKGLLGVEPGLYSPAEQAYWRAPVSYTHLRAHETVLDLVCRLLLEKKTRKLSTATSDAQMHATYLLQQPNCSTRMANQDV